MMHKNTKQLKNAYSDYLRSTYYQLSDCYINCSYEKHSAVNYILKLMYKYNGYGFKIIGFNSQTFSAGFIGEIDGKKAFFYITKCYDRYIFIDEIEV